MTPERPLATHVTDWLHDEAPGRASPDILAGALARVATTRQERYVTQRLFGDRTGRSWQLRWGLIAALLVLGLSGAVALAGALLKTPSIPATIGWLVYVVDPLYPGDESAGDIWLLRDGHPARRIVGTDGDGTDQACPDLAPGGGRLAWTASPVSNPNPMAIFVAELGPDGSPRRPTHVADLSDSGEQPLVCPEWSPDGASLAYARSGTVVVYELATGTTRRLDLAESEGVPVDLDWAPDARQLVVSTRRRIDIVPVDGSPPRVLARPIFTGPSGFVQEFDAVRWSPDGTRIATWGEGHPVTGGSFIQSINVDTGEPTDIATRGRYYGPRWSPDGHWLAFMEDRSLIRVVAADGTETRVLVTRNVASDPIWATNGHRIHYSAVQGDGGRNPANDRWALMAIDIEPGATPVVIVPFGPSAIHPTSSQEGP